MIPSFSSFVAKLPLSLLKRPLPEEGRKWHRKVEGVLITARLYIQCCPVYRTCSIQEGHHILVNISHIPYFCNIRRLKHHSLV